MPNTGTRQAKRTPVTLKIKFKSATLDQFIERYSVDVSHGGIFIRTKDPLAVGTTLKFEFQLKDASPLIRGEGTVVWTREHDPSRAGVAPGMGVRFDRLPPESQEVLDQILTQKAAKGGKARTPSNTGQFGDQPTRVAPSPLVAGLKSASAEAPKDDPVMGLTPPTGGFGGEGDRTDATPLPSPMPFHSDADDFPEEAFEEATRVAALNPALVAQTAREDGTSEDPFDSDSAGQPASPTVDEIAEKRAEKERAAREAKEAEDKRAAEAKAKAEAEDKARAEKEQAAKAKAEADKKAAQAKADKDKAAAAKAKADKGKAKADKAKADKAKADREAQVAAAAAAEEAPAERRSSGSILALFAAAVVILGVGGYVVFGMGKDDKGKKTEPVAKQDTPAKADTPEPAKAVEPAPAPVPEPAVELVEFELAGPAGATASLVGGDQSGEVPFTFKIEKDKPTEVRVSMEGFVAQVVTIESGKPAPKIKLVAKPRVVTVDSTPSGAAVLINGRRQQGTTPLDVELAGPLARAKTIKLTVSKAGFITGRTSFVAASAPWTDAGDAMKHSVSVELQERAAVAVKKAPVKKDEPVKVVKKDEPKKDEPKKDEPKKDEPVKVVKKDEPKKDEPKKDEPVKVVKKDEPKKDEPKKDEPKKDEPKADEGPTPDWMK